MIARKFCLLALGGLLLVFSSACQARQVPTAETVSASPLDSPLVAGLASSTETDEVGSDGRSLSAKEALPIAEVHAEFWSSRAVLIGIWPSRAMQRNLGLPPGRLGWFYQFQDPASGDELFVQVLDQELAGSTVAHPLVEDLPYTFQPINLGQVRVDTSEVVARYLDTADGQRHARQRTDVEWDFRLLQVNASPNPVWSLFDVENLGRSLLSVDATTGEIVDDPLP